MSELFWEDDFNRDDNAVVGNGWTTTTAGGNLQLIDGNLRQEGSSASNTAYATQTLAGLGSGFGNEVEVGAMVACLDDTTARQIALVLRSNADGTDAYWAQLTFDNDVATLKIVKRVGGSNTTAATAVVTTETEKVSSSYDGVYQRLAARIRDEEGTVIVDVFYNGEERPILSATDMQYPILRNGTTIGLRFGDNDGGTDGHLVAKNFFAQALVSAKSDFFEQVTVPYWNLGRLVAAARAIALRDSSDGAKGNVWAELANMAQQEYYENLGRPDWGEQIHSFTWPTSADEYELPAWVGSHDNLLRLGVDGYPIPVVDEAKWRETQSYDTTSTGTPRLVRVGGRGRSGGIILRAYPIPSSDTACSIRVFRHPLYMEADSDIPAIPQPECHHLVAGIIHLYALSDNSRTAISAWTRKWEKYLALARKTHARRKTLGTGSRLRPGLSRDRGGNVGWNGRSGRRW